MGQEDKMNLILGAYLVFVVHINVNNAININDKDLMSLESCRGCSKSLDYVWNSWHVAKSDSSYESWLKCHNNDWKVCEQPIFGTLYFCWSRQFHKSVRKLSENCQKCVS